MRFIHYYLVVIALLMAKLSVSQRGPITEIPLDVTKAIPTITHVSCVGETNGSVVLTPSGAGQPYTYTWQPGNTGGNSITTKGVGSYTATIYPPAFTLVLAGTYTYDIGYKANWVNLYPGLMVSGDDLVQNRTDMAGTWLEGAYTANTLLASTDGWIQYVITNTGYNKALGLLDVPGGLYSGYGDIDYGLMLNSGGSISRLNSGGMTSLAATYAVGDIIKIERIGSTINYKINGVIISSETVPSPLLLLNWVGKGVIYDYGARLEKFGCSFPAFYGSAGTSQTITCTTPSVTLSGSSSAPGVSYSWTPGGSTPSGSTTVVSSAGIYTLSITNSTVGCTAIYTVAVSSTIVSPNVGAGSTQTITCNTSTVVLNGSSTTPGVTYSWSPGGVTTPNYSVSATGTYTLKVTDPAGCSATSMVLVVSNTSGPSMTVTAVAGSSLPTSGLAAYWPFNGNAQDYSGNANHGTVSSATPATDRFGNLNKAYAFNGTSSRIDVPHSSSIDIGTGQDYTIAYWMKSNTGNVNGIIMSKAIYGTWNGYMFFVNNTDGGYCTMPGQCSFYVAAGAGGDACVNSPIANDPSNWYFITGKYNATSNITTIYVNGVLQTDVGSASAGTPNTKKLSFGAHNDMPAAGFYNGYLDDIRFYNRQLSQAEITALYNEPNPTATICAGNTVTLTATGASSYTWTTGATTNTIAVSPTVTTTYSVTGTGTNGCVSTQTVNIAVGSLLVNAGIPVFVSSGTSVSLGGSPSASLGSGSYSYSWTPSASYSPSSANSNPTITATTSANYTLTVIDLVTGCVKTDVKLVSIGDPPFCSVLKKTLDASYYSVINGKLYFTLDGDYSQTGLNYKVYNYSRTVMSGLSVNNTFLENGDNRFKMDVTGLTAGFYVLEVINQKNEKLLLRFKK